MSDFIRVPMQDGTERVVMTRLDDGSVMCALCFRYIVPDNLYVDEEGTKWDVCIPCAETEPDWGA